VPGFYLPQFLASALLLNTSFFLSFFSFSFVYLSNLGLECLL
jgi:hypothetical protein